MTTNRSARFAGGALLTVGVLLLVVSGVVWWSVWDLPAENVNQRMLLTLPILAIVFLGGGVLALVKPDEWNKPAPRRYPFLGRRRSR